MTKGTLVVSARLGSALLVGSAFGLLVGCGDAYAFKVSTDAIDPSAVRTGHACFDGSTVKLVRYSSECGRMSKSLVSTVREGIVFPADELRSLDSPCAEGPSPAIEVGFDARSHSILFDFRQVTQSDRFPDADFEGYMFDVALQQANGTLMAAMVDSEATTLDFDRNDIEVVDGSHLELNFEGVAYDARGLVKVDLIFARVAPPIDATP
jgi:hypothetical protein